MASQGSGEVIPSPKHVVFLFMAATVVAVVVFLCGVLVGRGVPPSRTAEGAGVGRGDDGLFVDVRRPSGVAPLNAEPPAAATSDGDLSYHRRLESDEPVVEILRREAPAIPGPKSPAPVVEASETVGTCAAVDQSPLLGPKVDVGEPAVARSAGLPSSATKVGATRVPGGSGFTVQVTALRARETAQQIASSLRGKGFPAYVVDPAEDAPVALFRVRVGPYPDRSDAEHILQRLESEEQFKPWITR